MKFFQHLRTVNHHRFLVMVGCFKVGLYRQGLTHDLSKYSPTEFGIGARYWQGTRSPTPLSVRRRVTAKPGCITRAVTGTTTNTGRICTR